MARMADGKGKLPENTDEKQVAQELGIVSTMHTEQETALERFGQEMSKNDQKAGIAQRPAGNVFAERTLRSEPDNCLSRRDFNLETVLSLRRRDCLGGGDDGRVSFSSLRSKKVSVRFLREGPLPWSTRVQIALDSARGLEYIHEHTVPVYIHRDIKSANILIDKNYRGKELPSEGSAHNKPLYISIECREKWILVVLVNTGLAINVCPCHTTYAIGLKPTDFVPTVQVISVYDNTSREVMGTMQIRVQLHQVRAVFSTLHQMLKYPHGKVVAIVFRNSSIHPPLEVTTPVLKIVHGEEDVFISGFTLVKVQVVQNILAVNESLYVNAQSVYLMNKLQHMPKMRLGRSDQKDVPHNPHASGLGYMPTKENWLQDSDTKERAEPITAEAAKSTKNDSDSNEFQMGAALACLFSDPQINSESLGDDLTISMIGDQPGANPSSGILDASGAPSLTWQLEEGYLSSSSKSGSKPESDSIESVESESNFGSFESGSGIPGIDNPDAEVLSRSSFSFSFESVVTEELDELDLLNENATADFEYFSVPLVYCIDHDFQNFDENDKKGIPRVLKHLINQEEERFVKPLVDEIISINVGIEKDPRLVQIGSTLSSEECEHSVALLKDLKDVFVWSYEDMLGIDPEIVQHRIPLDPEA
ncbi:hypothetical protein HYC85_029405 [Camellia sinensis]|uniref:Protein kinase domain-containing protein n=1 Tax=Camellia sinensis TaxID=4442 RepID=A0A7J7G1U5_CAMSI|nr:hypothetical protein HYC85_029405 [Camellia sinensis]